MRTPTGTRRLVVVSAGLSTPSSTRLLADRITTATVDRLADDGIVTDVAVIELRDHALDITRRLVNGFATSALDDAVEGLTAADGAILTTPIFAASYSGLFKSFLDIIDPVALRELPVVIGATGGSDRHSLALDYAVRPTMTYLHAVVAPTGVYAATSDWGRSDTGLTSRIERAAGELAALMRFSTRNDLVRDPLALPAGFDPTGRN